MDEKCEKFVARPSVYIAAPQPGDTNDENPLVVCGSVSDGQDNVDVTATLIDVTGVMPNRSKTGKTTDTGCFDILFNDVAHGKYNITASASGYSDGGSANVTVPNPNAETIVIEIKKPGRSARMDKEAKDLTLWDEVTVHDAYCAVIILERQVPPGELVDVKVDFTVFFRHRWQVTFKSVPSGRYIRKSRVYRLSGKVDTESVPVRQP